MAKLRAYFLAAGCQWPNEEALVGGDWRWRIVQDAPPMVRVCFVCLGNICRSPTAEAVMRQLVRDNALTHDVLIESAGTAAHHVGEGPDERTRSAALRRGMEVGGVARQWAAQDWQRFDYVLPVDLSTYSKLSSTQPTDCAGKLRLLRSFDDEAPEGSEVPDPYYGGEQGFEQVLDLCHAACEGLLRHLRSTGEVG